MDVTRKSTTGSGWYIDIPDLEDIAFGTSFLGSGGGANPKAMVLQAERAIHEHGPVRVMDVSDLADDALVAPCGWVGAPTVCEEKIANGRESVLGIRKVEDIHGRPVTAVFPMEIGGSNGITAIVTAAKLGLPVVDCDGMGRAFPESQMVTFNIYGQSACPAVINDGAGNVVVLDAVSSLEEERFVRGLCVMMGASCHVIDYVSSGYMVKQHAVRRTLSIARGIGRAVRQARRDGGDPFQALYGFLHGSSGYGQAGTLFDGKVIDVERSTEGGFSIGQVIIEGYGAGAERLEIRFQNENLVARCGNRILGMVPDIITILDRETAEAIATERVRYGQRVRVAGSSVPHVLRTPAALKIVGPQAFGIDRDYVEIEVLNKWKQTIETDS